ncbi:MAG: inositol monophosphatase [Legionella sp.]|uniref:inositol monophosphatase family protein n=1 Tax=Legionella sp. TaxID=459 RepID=UPI002847AB57|nr:inositol monophosphatase [Legionella sp.]
MTEKQFAISIAKQAGKIIRANFRLGMEKTIKKDGSPVTKTDLAINKLVVDQVNKYFPGHGVLGEEQSNLIDGAEYVWVCDPVDGTIPFSHGMPTCMFSLGLTRHGKSIMGVGYDPFMDRMLFGSLGKGAFLNGKKIRVSKQKTLKTAFISFGAWTTMSFPMPDLNRDLIFKYGCNIFPIGSIVYNAMLLAAGEIDAIIFPHYTAHDVAAIKVIVEEAGGKVTDLDGRDQRYDRPVNGCILSNGLIHKNLVNVVRKHNINPHAI